MQYLAEVTSSHTCGCWEVQLLAIWGLTVSSRLRLQYVEVSEAHLVVEDVYITVPCLYFDNPAKKSI